jgi:hypothetical protein
MHKISQLTARRQNSRQHSTFKLSNYVAQLGLVTDPDDFQVIAFCPEFVPLTGGLAPAMLFGQLLYLTGSGQSDADGWVDQTQRELQQRTTLTRWAQELARRKLRQRHLLDEKWSDDPDRGRCYRINVPLLVDLWRHHYGPPVKTSGRQRPRRTLVAVTTLAPPADDAQPDPPQQTDLFLPYETPQSSPPGGPRKTASTLRESRSPSPVRSTAQAPAKHTNDSTRMEASNTQPPAASAPETTDKNSSDFPMMRVSHIPPAENPHHEIAEITSEISGMQVKTGAESIKEKQKDFSRTRGSDAPVVSVVPGAAEKKFLPAGQEQAAATPPTGPRTKPVRTPAPAQVPITEDIKAFAAERTPGFTRQDLEHHRDVWLHRCRTRKYAFEEWAEELKGYLLEAHYRAKRSGQLPAAPRTPTPATPSATDPRDAAWCEAYDDKYVRPPRRTPDEAPPAAEIPAEAGLGLAEALAAGMRFPPKAEISATAEMSGRLGTTSEPQGLRIVREALEASQGTRSGELDWCAREVLEQARDARSHGQLSVGQFHAAKARLRTAASLAEVTTIAAEIGGCSVLEPAAPGNHIPSSV